MNARGEHLGKFSLRFEDSPLLRDLDYSGLPEDTTFEDKQAYRKQFIRDNYYRIIKSLTDGILAGGIHTSGVLKPPPVA